jgi:DNA topoisomerase I
VTACCPRSKWATCISLDKLRPEQHFTEPPPRFTEASLVKTLEEYGIGRPSTYASIIATLRHREYVDMDGKRFIPTDIGRIVICVSLPSTLRSTSTTISPRDWKTISMPFHLGEGEFVPLLERFWKPSRRWSWTRSKASLVSRQRRPATLAQTPRAASR